MAGDRLLTRRATFAAAPVLTSLARAKVNLTLEIKGKRGDSYHELESLVLFADFGDLLEYRSGADPSLQIEGPFAEELRSGVNLIEKAAEAYEGAFGVSVSGAFRLIKTLPVAAGIGGGSADAAAALRLLQAANGAPADISELVAPAQLIGADVPCCLYARALVMSGIGERLHILPPMAPIPAILVNPLRPLSTRDVFHTLDAGPLPDQPSRIVYPSFASADELFAYALTRGNDLETPAKRLLPEVEEVLSTLSAAPGVRLARLSGSGPTCFAMFAGAADAQSAAQKLMNERPDWWTRPVMLN